MIGIKIGPYPNPDMLANVRWDIMENKRLRNTEIGRMRQIKIRHKKTKMRQEYKYGT